MKRIARKHLLTIARNGHFFFITFDDASRDALFDYLMDLAQNPEVPLGWQDVFRAIDAVGAATRASARKHSKLRI